MRSSSSEMSGVPMNSRSCGLPFRLSFPDELPHRHAAGGLRPVNIALGIRGHAFPRYVGLRVRPQSRDEGFDHAVPRAADPDAALEAGVHLLVRLVIDHVEHVVRVDINPARPAELLPLLEKISVRVEDLDTAVGP